MFTSFVFITACRPAHFGD